MWTGRIALETIPPSQAEGKHYLERFILQAANPANANTAFETGLLTNKPSRGLLTAALKRKQGEQKWKKICDFILLFVLTAGWKYQVYQLLRSILVDFQVPSCYWCTDGSERWARMECLTSAVWGSCPACGSAVQGCCNPRGLPQSLVPPEGWQQLWVPAKRLWLPGVFVANTARGYCVPCPRWHAWQGHGRDRDSDRAVPAQHSWARDTNTFCANKAVSAEPGQHQSALKTCCICAWCYRRWEIRVGMAQTQFLI